MPAKKKVATKARPVEGQKKRVPLHEARNKMTVTGLCPKDHKDRWVLDGMENDPYRVQRFLNAGWKFVNKNGSTTSDFSGVGDRTVNSAESTDSRVTMRVSTGTYYYMVIEKKFYDEDKAARAEKVNRTEEAIRNVANGEDKYGSISVSK